MMNWARFGSLLRIARRALATASALIPKDTTRVELLKTQARLDAVVELMNIDFTFLTSADYLEPINPLLGLQLAAKCNHCNHPITLTSSGQCFSCNREIIDPKPFQTAGTGTQDIDESTFSFSKEEVETLTNMVSDEAGLIGYNMNHYEGVPQGQRELHNSLVAILNKLKDNQ